MTGIFRSIEVGRSALLAQQAVLNTIGHNLANAGTPGYTRQRAELVPQGIQDGVAVSAILRIRDRFLDFSVLTESAALGQFQAQQGMMQRLEAVFNDPAGTGLNSVLDGFFQGLQDVSANPTDQAFRVALRDDGARVATLFNGMQGRIDQLKGDLNTQIRENVTRANSLLSGIADLHRQILASGGGPPPNDLFDKRDNLVEQLNAIIGVSATDRPNGTVQLAVSGSGVLIVDGDLVAPLSTSINAGTDTLDLKVGSLVLTPRGGALSAVLTARNSPTGPVKQAAADLDTLARSVITEVNRLHASGTGLVEPTSLTALNAVSSSAVPLTAAGLPFTPGSGSFRVIVHDGAGAVQSSVTVPVTAGTTTLDDIVTAINADPDLSATVTSGKLTIAAAGGATFAFADDSSDTLMALGVNVFFKGSTANDIGLSPAIAADPNAIAAARADATGLVHPGDGSNALALAGLGTRLTMNSGTATFADFFGTAVGSVGSQALDANDAVDRQQAAVQVVQSLQQQTSSVSVDEELIALTQAQNDFAAAARFITTTQNMVQTLLNMF